MLKALSNLLEIANENTVRLKNYLRILKMNSDNTYLTSKQKACIDCIIVFSSKYSIQRNMSSNTECNFI